jgi:hypothetical protein
MQEPGLTRIKELIFFKQRSGVCGIGSLLVDYSLVESSPQLHMRRILELGLVVPNVRVIPRDRGCRPNNCE